MKRLILLAVTIGLVALPASSSRAEDAEDATSPDETVELVATQDPFQLPAADVRVSSDEAVSVQKDLEVALPLDSGSPVTVSGDGGTLEVSVPGNTEATIVGDSAVYSDALPGVDVVAQAVDGGARQVFVLQSEDSQTSVSFSAGEADTQLVQNPDGTISVLDGSTQEEIAGINAPWASDASGALLPTSYTIDGNVITQHVDTAGATFPIAADPTICGNKIKNVRFGRRDGGTTMFVTPTGCGRWWNGRDGWKEAQREGKRSYRGSQERSMWNQYICHFDWAPFKSSWNLDEWRPNVGYAKTVARGCNP